MNEGWASYWHSTIMTQNVLKDSEVIDYADHHSGTLSTSPGRINPYKIGIELTVTLRIGGTVELRASRPVETSEVVSCVIPGHHHPGTELYTDTFVVDDGPFEWELSDRCAFVTDFEYRSDA